MSHTSSVFIFFLLAGVSEQAIVQFFNGALLAAAGVDYSVASASGQFPVLKAEIGPRRADAVGQADHRYCFLEFRTIADANMCLKLDGMFTKNTSGWTSRRAVF